MLIEIYRDEVSAETLRLNGKTYDQLNGDNDPLVDGMATSTPPAELAALVIEHAKLHPPKPPFMTIEEYEEEFNRLTDTHYGVTVAYMKRNGNGYRRYGIVNRIARGHAGRIPVKDAVLELAADADWVLWQKWD